MAKKYEARRGKHYSKKKYEARRRFGKEVRGTAKRNIVKKEVRGTTKAWERSTRHGEGTRRPQIPSLILELPRVHGHRDVSFGLMLGGVQILFQVGQTPDLEHATGRPRTPRTPRKRSHHRQDKPRLTAYAFRMTLEVQGNKFPQIIM